MENELWNYFEKLRSQGDIIDLEKIADFISKNKIGVPKEDIISIIKKNRFFGEYYTPDNIAKFMAELGKIEKPKTMIDICCGVGNILFYCDYALDKEGIDLNRGAVSIAKIINPNAKISVGDSLKKTFKKKYDLVLGDFPFGLRIRDKNKTSLGESLFIKKGLSILSKNGVLICTVPNSFLFYKNFQYMRKLILNDYNLKLITNMPSGRHPLARIRFAILYIKNSRPTEKIYITDYKDNSDEIIDSFVKGTGISYVTKDEFKEKWPTGSHDPEFSEIEKKLKGRDVKSLEEMADVFVGYSPKPHERLDEGEYLIVGGRNITDGIFRRTNKDKYINYVNSNSFKNSILKPGDIIVNLLFTERKIYIYQENDPKAVLNNSCALIRSPDNEYILTYLRTKEGQRIFLKQADKETRLGLIPRLTINDLKRIKIPILPIDNLKKVSMEEIDKSSLDELKDVISSLDIGLQEKISSLVKKFGEEIKSKIKNKISRDEIINRIKYGESTKLEFKSTLRYNIHSKCNDEKIENSVLKNIVAFCNSDGGEILIGINDEGEILGTELDNFRNRDKFMLHLGNLIENRIVPSIDEFIDYKIIEINQKEICQIICRKSSKPSWFKPDKNKDEQFFIRTGPSSKPLSPMKAFEYINDHFKKRGRT